MPIYKVTTLVTTRAFHLVEADDEDQATSLVEVGGVPSYRRGSELPQVVRVEELDPVIAHAFEFHYAYQRSIAPTTPKEG